MPQLKNDFDFLVQITEEFFRQKSIIKKLQEFEEFNIKGWEIWLQVEFAIFLFQHEQVSEVEREKKYILDLRKSKDKISCSIDFMIRQKFKQSFIPLEIKQHYYASNCITSMLNDISKYEKIRGTSLSTDRYLWCLGVHRTVEENYLKELIFDNQTRDFDERLVKYFQIPRTDYMFTLI